MRLKSITIENFRAIKNCSITFHELTAIVGENNSGKTAILRALDSFFNYENEKCDFQNGAHRYAPRTITKIVVTFSEVPDKDDYSALLDSNGEMRIRFTYNYSKSGTGRRLYYEKNGECRPIEVSFIDTLKTDIDFIYIPASRSSRDIEWSEESVFTKLITRYLENYTKNRDTLSQKAIVAGNKILEQVLQRLARELTDLNMCNDIGQYQINYKSAVDYTIFLDRLGLGIVNTEETRSLPVTEYGSGIKSLTVIALHRMLANLNGVSIVLGIEEPETNLHPQAQRQLIDSLKKARQSCETQAVFATHSTVIVDALEHEDIVLVRKIKDTNRDFHAEAKQLSDTFWEDYGIQELKHYNFFRYRNSDFFFSRFVVLAESITDAQVIEHLLKNESSDKLYYVSIINLEGVKNIKYPFFLLRDLGIPFVAVVDKDFFTGYKNDSLEMSRNEETWLPEYSGTLTNSKAIQAVFDETTRKVLQSYLNASYTQFFDYVKSYGFLPMQYCLEMDLVANEKTREKYYDFFDLEGEQRNTKTLLIDKKNAIKEPTVLLPIVQSVSPRDYPISYKKIRRYLLNIITEL